MPRLTPIHWKKLQCVFEQDGFKVNRIAGSHIALVKAGVLRPIIIPKYSAVGKDIIMSNIKTAEMSRDKYFELLDKC